MPVPTSEPSQADYCWHYSTIGIAILCDVTNSYYCMVKLDVILQPYSHIGGVASVIVIVW